MKPPPIPAHDLLQAAILGALGCGLVQAVVWLVTGDLPTYWVGVLSGVLVALVVDVLIDVRRRREQQRIRETYERPAFGEDA
ncbi:hypothetical protein [Streptomyces abikoensis]|uniref:hypothetical protein n=1 Tax=Streptomyces abikoensis TaxID=97398 RepID=UPI001677D226|nr:hypothetical protein [Streptomyces abikoensis]GGP55699.1 hypothetical protein GCM10010214_31120 [Streptomyces abikoensis]